MKKFVPLIVLAVLSIASTAFSAAEFHRWGLRLGGGYSPGVRDKALAYDPNTGGQVAQWGQGMLWDVHASYALSKSLELSVGATSPFGFKRNGSYVNAIGATANYKDEFQAHSVIAGLRLKPAIAKDMRLISGLGAGWFFGGEERSSSSFVHPLPSSVAETKDERAAKYSGGMMYKGEIGLAYELSPRFSLELGFNALVYPLEEASWNYKQVRRNYNGTFQMDEGFYTYEDVPPAQKMQTWEMYDHRVGGTGFTGTIYDIGSSQYESYSYYEAGVQKYTGTKSTYRNPRMTRWLVQGSVTLAIVTRF